MKILGIETATLVCGAAVVVDGRVVREEQIQQKSAHAEHIMRLIDAAVQQSHISLHQIDAIAVSIGPGSFTGLRIGLSVAKGLVYATDKPLVAVSTLRAVAQRAVDAGIVETPFLLSAIDARRDEVYCQLFHVNGTGLKPVWEERAATLDAVFNELIDGRITVTGDAVAKLTAHARGSSMTVIPEAYATCSAATVGLLGEQMARLGQYADTRTIEPKYIKEFYLNVPN